MSCNGQRFVTGGNIDRQTGGHRDEVQSYSSALGTLGDKKIKFKSLGKKSLSIETEMSLLYLPLTKIPLHILDLDC